MTFVSKPVLSFGPTLLTFAAWVTTPAFADGEHGVGNGGIAVVCRNDAGKITHAETLDLFEGRNLKFKLQYDTQNQNIDQLIELAQLKMIANPDFLKQFRETLPEVKAAALYLAEGIGNTPTDDAFPKIFMKGCTFEQLGSYDDDEGSLSVDDEIYNLRERPGSGWRLPRMEKAAFFVHETIYRMARKNAGDVSSVRSRKLTAQVLALNSRQEVIDRLMMALSPKPVVVSPLPRGEILAGIYAPNEHYCAYQLAESVPLVPGNYVKFTTVSNPIRKERCSDEGQVLLYVVKPSTGYGSMTLVPTSPRVANNCGAPWRGNDTYCQLVHGINPHSIYFANFSNDGKGTNYVVEFIRF